MSTRDPALDLPLPSPERWAAGRLTRREALAVIARHPEWAEMLRETYDLIPRLADVRVERDADPPAARCLPQHTDLWFVHPVWADVDRPDTGGWLVRGEKLARRLERAVRAGKALGPATIAVDVNGNTYVQADHLVMSKYMNADLRRLGF